MGKESKSGRGKRRWWLAGGILACVVLAGAAGAWFVFAGRKVWTDDRDIRRPDDAVSLRYVLWAEPRALGEQFNTRAQEYEPSTTPDGDELYFVRGLPGEGADLYVSRRGPQGRWTRPAPVSAVNTEYDELGPRVTPDGRFLLFYSDRPGGAGQYDIWAARRTDKGWARPFNLGPTINTRYNEYGPAMGPEGKRLYFATNRKAAAGRKEKDFWRATIRQSAAGDYDLFVAELAEPAPGEQRGEAQPGAAPARVRLQFARARELEGVNTPYHEGACCVSPGGDFLYFASDRPGGLGGLDLYRCRLAAGRAGRVENLGQGINTPANEADPQLAMGGFLLHFSSDRTGSRGGYDLFVAESREVYATRSSRPLPRLGWSWWALLAAVAALVPLLLFLRAAGYKHLSLLQKCVVGSLMFHILLTILLSAWKMSQVFIEYVAREAGMTLAVNLEMSKEVETKQQIRRQIVDLPVATHEMTDLPRAVAEKPPRVSPKRPRTNVPRMTIRPEPVVAKPQRPKLIPPAPTDKVTLPAPRLFASAPRVEVAADRRVAEAEAVPTPQQARPPPPIRPAETEAPELAARQVAAADAPIRPRAESMARPTDAGRRRLAEREPVRPKARTPARPVAAGPEVRVSVPEKIAADEGLPRPSLAARPAEMIRAAVTTVSRPVAQTVVAAAAPVRPRVESLVRPAVARRPAEAKTEPVRPEARAPRRPLAEAPPVGMAAPKRIQAEEDAPAAAAAPPSGVAMLVQRTVAQRSAARSVATRAEPAAPRTGSFVTVRPRLDLARPVTERVPPEAHVLQEAALKIASPARPVPLTPVRASGPTVTPRPVASAKLPAAAPKTDPAGPRLAVPSGQPTRESLAVAISVTPRAPVKTLLVAIDLHSAEQGPLVRLPDVRAVARRSERPPTSPPNEPDELKPLLVGAVARDRPGRLVKEDGPPAERADQSLVDQLLADARNPRRIDTIARRPLPRAELLPLAGLLGPGRLAAPRSLFQRSFEQRRRLINEMGGSRETEAAVARALAYLARNQEADGRWTYFIAKRAAGGRHAVDVATTGLAALCFLAADHTPAKPGPYRLTITKALDRLLKFQKPDGDLRGGAQMYSHAIATLALGEAAAMTDDVKYSRAAIRGAEFIVRAQHPAGGWRYAPRQAGDTSVVGWQVMALHSVERLGWKIPENTRNRALGWLHRVSGGKHKTLAGYQSPSPSPAMAAEGTFSRLLLGTQFTQAELEEISSYLMKHPPGSSKNLYYYYYASLALMQLQNEAWTKWNAKMRDYLVKLQKPDGSWDTATTYGSRGGRVYTTALSTLTLEVYYRYLPMYGPAARGRTAAGDK